MAQSFPFTYYSCPCVDISSSASSTLQSKRSSQQQIQDEDEEEQTFNPKNPRANYSLYPIEHLLYCEDCHQIRCPRCVVEEPICWYCPSCLFEVPTSTVKSEGNRCTRSCYNCPLCTAPLQTHSLAEDDGSGAAPGPYYMSCPYCHWSTLDIGIEFEKHTGITQQLARIKNGGKVVPTLRERERERDRRRDGRGSSKPDDLDEEEDVLSPGASKATAETPIDPDDLAERFSNLQAFYKTQLTDGFGRGSYGTPGDLNYSSPSSLTRIMNLYNRAGSRRGGKEDKPKPMREAYGLEEGIKVFDPADDQRTISRLAEAGWEGTLSAEQQSRQLQPLTKFMEDVRPIATLLRTKRIRRCRTCRQIVSRPEPKVQSSRYKIRLLALNNIPKLSIRALSAASTNPSLPSSVQPTSAIQFDYAKLKPLMPTQFLLTLRNPLFDSIRVTLATPATTPGRVASRVTILCPQFDVGANTDVWNEVLETSSSSSKKPAIEAGSNVYAPVQAEAGKVWERGRNWTSVIVEVVPGTLPAELEEDEDVVEIPVFVRAEYETEASEDKKGDRPSLGGTDGAKPGMEKREEAFWSVLGVGKIVDG